MTALPPRLARRFMVPTRVVHTDRDWQAIIAAHKAGLLSVKPVEKGVAEVAIKAAAGVGGSA